MFIRSAASDTLQGRAITRAEERWGSSAASNACASSSSSGSNLRRPRRGNSAASTSTGVAAIAIAVPVCKKKYSPFEFRIRRKRQPCADGSPLIEVYVERMYGCQAHSKNRRQAIERHGGERDGWEPFGQWSLSKAKAAARRETARLNGLLAAAHNNVNSSAELVLEGGKGSLADLNAVEYISRAESASSLSTSTANSPSSSSSEDESKNNYSGWTYNPKEDPASMRQRQSWQTLCHDGRCNWKIRGKFDDICEEIKESRNDAG